MPILSVIVAVGAFSFDMQMFHFEVKISVRRPGHTQIVPDADLGMSKSIILNYKEGCVWYWQSESHMMFQQV